MKFARNDWMAGRETAINSNCLTVYVGSFFACKESNHGSNLFRVTASKMFSVIQEEWEAQMLGISTYLHWKAVATSRVQLANLVGWSSRLCIIKSHFGHTSFNKTLRIIHLEFCTLKDQIINLMRRTGQIAFTRTSVPAYWKELVWQRLMILDNRYVLANIRNSNVYNLRSLGSRVFWWTSTRTDTSN